MSTNSPPLSDPASREPNTGIYPDVLAQVALMFGRNLEFVLRAHTQVEAATNETNLIGRQNLIEAFTHLATLLARAPELTHSQQHDQVTHFSDHLRRVMMESFEVEVNVVIGTIWDETDPNSVGRQYDAHAAPLISRGKLLGHITPPEITEPLNTIKSEVLRARAAKVADGDFAEWQDASQALRQAGERARQLRREVGAAVDASNNLRSARRQMVIGAIISAAIGAGLTLVLTALL